MTVIELQELFFGNSLILKSSILNQFSKGDQDGETVQ